MSEHSVWSPEHCLQALLQRQTLRVKHNCKNQIWRVESGVCVVTYLGSSLQQKDFLKMHDSQYSHVFLRQMSHTLKVHFFNEPTLLTEHEEQNEQKRKIQLSTSMSSSCPCYLKHIPTNLTHLTNHLTVPSLPPPTVSRQPWCHSLLVLVRSLADLTGPRGCVCSLFALVPVIWGHDCNRL